MKSLLFTAITIFSLMSFAQANPQRFVSGVGVGSYPFWIARPEFLEFEIKALADKNAIELCQGEVTRVSEFAFSENYETAPLVTVTGSANYECF